MTTTLRLQSETARALQLEAERLAVLDLGKQGRKKAYFLNNIIQEALLNVNDSRFIEFDELTGRK